VRATVSEATRDRAQMLFMKATRSGSEVELWINSLKRKKRKNKQPTTASEDQHNLSVLQSINNDERMMAGAFYSPESDIFNTQDISRQQQQQQLTAALEQFLDELNETTDGFEFLFEEGLSSDDLLRSIQNKQQQLQAQQVLILREIMLVQQEIFL
jgi:hypothetical protein